MSEKPHPGIADFERMSANDATSPQHGEPLLSSFASDPDMVELVEYFVGELDDRMATIRAALERNDRSTIRRIAHQLRGAAGGYGFHAVGEAAAEVERLAHPDASPFDDLRSAADALISLCGRARVRP
jgi:HPt (histidine-containing phosphotransfer) domain-containing protein